MLPTPDAQFFKDLSREWMEAWKSRNKEKLNNLVAEDFLYISRMVKGMCVGKKEWLRMAMELYVLESYELQYIKVAIQAQAAIVIYKQIMKTRPDHTGESTLHIVTDVWALVGGRWQAISRQPVQIE
jgi:biotin synthase-related radical SAM superfamily protein